MITQSAPLFFLVGCSRSGTTLLQSLLATHPQIASFPETKFFHVLLPSPYERRRYAFNLASRQLNSRLAVFFGDELGRPDLIRRIPKVPLMSHCTHQFIKILRELAAEQNKSIILEKTPDHIYRIESIEKFLPSASFIHLIRNGTDVVASLYEVTHQYPKPWGGVRDIDTCIDNWLSAIRATQKYQNQPNHLIVRYENLVSQAETVLRKICNFLNVEFDVNMIENYAEMAHYVSLDREGRSVNCDGINYRPSNKFFKIFNEEQQAYIMDKLSVVNLEELNW
ncbi:sulfotransferase [Lyngbya sp. CCY1209]|uniref:sulfotransferase family protein n=1 Tax=Lyngbya sp. CCY1209 TaxID=2886103 RepID=UPI002D205531|nr:sulfotransferase [Lyngbya sp. CCY1209]MEB3885637.1 sulfotransferase [Lyngbya sp. CCY1209]